MALTGPRAAWYSFVVIEIKASLNNYQVQKQKQQQQQPQQQVNMTRNATITDNPPITVKSEIFARILFSRIVLKHTCDVKNS